jgi:hypothetical protein
LAQQRTRLPPKQDTTNTDASTDAYLTTNKSSLTTDIPPTATMILFDDTIFMNMESGLPYISPSTYDVVRLPDYVTQTTDYRYKASRSLPSLYS